MSDGDGLPLEGVDYAFGTPPSPAALVAAGKRFVVRYGGPGTEGKWIHADEAQALAAAGLWIVANAEGSATGLGNGWSTGVSWAKSADKWFHDIGMPTDRPIYLSADFDVTAEDWPAVADALRGAASVIGSARVGVYGGYNVMRWAARDGVAKWFWQTYAWSAGRWAPGNHIEQYLNGVPIDGADCDLNRARQVDYGQWMPGRLPTKRSTDMLMGKTADKDTVYVGDGLSCRALDSDTTDAAAVAEAFGVLQKVLGPPIVFSTKAAMEAALGTEAGDEDGGGSGGGGIDEDTARRIVREELDKTRLATGPTEI
jgi:hypothetical protein